MFLIRNRQRHRVSIAAGGKIDGILGVRLRNRPAHENGNVLARAEALAHKVIIEGQRIIYRVGAVLHGAAERTARTRQART